MRSHQNNRGQGNGLDRGLDGSHPILNAVQEVGLVQPKDNKVEAPGREKKLMRGIENLLPTKVEREKVDLVAPFARGPFNNVDAIR